MRSEELRRREQVLRVANTPRLRKEALRMLETTKLPATDIILRLALEKPGTGSTGDTEQESQTPLERYHRDYQQRLTNARTVIAKTYAPRGKAGREREQALQLLARDQEKRRNAEIAAVARNWPGMADRAQYLISCTDLPLARAGTVLLPSSLRPDNDPVKILQNFQQAHEAKRTQEGGSTVKVTYARESPEERRRLESIWSLLPQSSPLRNQLEQLALDPARYSKEQVVEKLLALKPEALDLFDYLYGPKQSQREEDPDQGMSDIVKKVNLRRRQQHLTD
jgi:hypothetical protein